MVTLRALFWVQVDIICLLLSLVKNLKTNSTIKSSIFVEVLENILRNICKKNGNTANFLLEVSFDHIYLLENLLKNNLQQIYVYL